MRDKIFGNQMKSSFEGYQYNHCLEEKHKFFLRSFIGVLKHKIYLATAQYVLTSST